MPSVDLALSAGLARLHGLSRYDEARWRSTGRPMLLPLPLHLSKLCTLCGAARSRLLLGRASRGYLSKSCLAARCKRDRAVARDSVAGSRRDGQVLQVDLTQVYLCDTPTATADSTQQTADSRQPTADVINAGTQIVRTRRTCRARPLVGICRPHLSRAGIYLRDDEPISCRRRESIRRTESKSEFERTFAANAMRARSDQIGSGTGTIRFGSV